MDDVGGRRRRGSEFGVDGRLGPQVDAAGDGQAGGILEVADRLLRRRAEGLGAPLGEGYVVTKATEGALEGADFGAVGIEVEIDARGHGRVPSKGKEVRNG